MSRLLRIPYALDRRTFLRGAAGVAFVLRGPVFGCASEVGSEGADAGGDVAPWPDGGPAAGDGGLDATAQAPRVRLLGESTVPAGTKGTWAIEYDVPPGGMAAGRRLAVAVEHGTDWGAGQDASGAFPSRFGGMVVTCPTRAGTDIGFKVSALRVASASNAVEIILDGGDLAEGDTIRVTLGDPAAGDLIQAPTIAHDAVIRVLEHLDDRKTDDDFLLYEEVLPTPTVRVLPREPAALSVLAGSGARPGEPLSLVVRVEDVYGNVVTDFEGAVELYDDEVDQHLGTVQADGGAVRSEGLVVDREAVVRLRAEVPELSLVAYGGPIEVTAAVDAAPVRWGQLHGHSLVSDGLGTATSYYAHARDLANLDFASLSDHGYVTEQAVDFQFFRHFIGPEAWEAYAQVTRAFHDPGRFVTFLSYEWTSNLYSDKIVYFLDDQEPWQPYPEDLEGFYALYAGRGAQVTVISHMMWAVPLMRAIDWDTFDGELERVVEVASVHGAREYAGNPYWVESDPWTQEHADHMAGHMVADGLAKGHRLGLVCGADCHQGLPGNSHRGRHACRCDGLMAIRTATLTREERVFLEGEHFAWSSPIWVEPS